MPKILIVTVIHGLLFGLGGIVLGLMVFGVGFSESDAIKYGYTWIVRIWEVLNNPAASYFLHTVEPSLWIGIPLQLLTSFIWANIFLLIWSFITKRIKKNR